MDTKYHEDSDFSLNCFPSCTLVPFVVKALQSSTTELASWLLHVENFPIQESHLQIFINVNLLRPQVHNLLRLAHGRLDLIRSHALLDALRLRLRLWLLISLLLLALISLLAALVSASLLRVVTDREHLPDNIF